MLTSNGLKCAAERSAGNSAHPASRNPSRAPTPAETKMVEQLNRQRVINMLETFYAGDLEGALDRCTDDVDYIASAPVDILPHLGHHRGRAEVRQMWQTVRARYTSMRYEAPITVAEGDKGAVYIRA